MGILWAHTGTVGRIMLRSLLGKLIYAIPPLQHDHTVRPRRVHLPNHSHMWPRYMYCITIHPTAPV